VLTVYPAVSWAPRVYAPTSIAMTGLSVSVRPSVCPSVRMTHAGTE